MFIVGSTGVSIVHLSGGIASLGLVGDAVYALAIASLPGLSKSYSLLTWIIPDIDGWRGTAIHWAFIAVSLTFLLPEVYGKDVAALMDEYEYAYPPFKHCLAIFSGLIVLCLYGRRGYPWSSLLAICGLLGRFLQCGFLMYKNYV
ncbi:hypothetical protein NX059_007730 [Plenodomus lindquistii]|nr:hypothetical protein NX059_007730 [Plenodomus lindquistii]